MRRLIILLAGIAVLAAANAAIAQRERQLAAGAPVLLALAPVDPRSLMQGDYMELRFAVEDDIARVAGERRSGVAVVRVDARGVGAFARIDDGSPLAAGEQRLRFRQREGRMRVGPGAWFFPEGGADRFQAARFGQLRCAADGAVLLAAMHDADLRRL